MSDKGVDADPDAVDRQFAEQAQKATEAAYMRALRDTGSVIIARDGSLLRRTSDGMETVIARISPRIRKSRKSYKFEWTPPSQG